MNEDRIPKKVLNMKVKENVQDSNGNNMLGKQWEQHVRKNMGRHGGGVVGGQR
jgi:hypothetical protein